MRNATSNTTFFRSLCTLAGLLMFAAPAGCGDDVEPASGTLTTNASPPTSDESDDTSDEQVHVGGFGDACPTDHDFHFCEVDLECDQPRCDKFLPGGFGMCTRTMCVSDDECATVDGFTQSCRPSEWMADDSVMTCMWLCNSDADCPKSVDAELTCFIDPLSTLGRCTPACPSEP